MLFFGLRYLPTVGMARYHICLMLNAGDIKLRERGQPYEDAANTELRIRDPVTMEVLFHLYRLII